jgi:diguanylate cyclase (GGDEF)-like protein
LGIFEKIGLDCFSLVICAVMYFNNLKVSEKHMTQNRLFRWLILITMTVLTLEIGGILVDGQQGVLFYILNNIINTIFFVLNPLAAMMWALYASYQLFHDIHRLKIEATLLLIPITINAIMSSLSPSLGLMFRIDSENVYQRGPLFLVLAFVSLLPIVYSTILYIIFRKRISRNFLIPMLLFMVPPVIGATIQTLFYGFNILWSSITVSIFIVHNSVQNQKLNLDHLTGVFNRRQIDNYINDRIKSAKKGKSFSCIILDIDNFKSINDKYGHLVGDEALLDIVHILKSCIRNDDFLARYGGDEFIIVLDIIDEHKLKQTIARIQDYITEYNQTSLKPFILSISSGYKVYDSKSRVSRKEFIAKIDSLMYQDKGIKVPVAC